MQLKTFKTLWGHTASLENAIAQAKREGFDGIEGPAPISTDAAEIFAEQLKEAKLDYIAEITTAGSYVPNRHASLAEHLEDFEQKLEQSLLLKPLFITCLGGCDAWPEERSIEFFNKALAIANTKGVTVSFETHRGRSFFNPWVTERIVKAIPQIRLTCDYSHWCVVCERLMDSEQHVLEALAPHAFHIHARVGYEQGPQVSHPAAPENAYALKAHQSWWEMIWQAQQQQGMQTTTLTPEFGPDGYLHHQPFANEPVADLWQINCWMAEEERKHFAQWLNRAK